MTTKNFKPTLKTPTKQGKKLNKHFNKELTKQSSMQQVQKPNIKIKEDKDDFAMKQSGYNDLGVGKLKTNRKKDLDPSFQNLNYIDESDNISLGPIKRNINKNLITKKELIESTLKENKEGFISKEESIAEELMKKDYEIWKKLNIKSGNDLYPYLGANPSIWVKYEGLIKKMLNNYGFDFRNTISTNIRDIIENENYHSLNQAIETLRYGEGKYERDSVFFHDEEQLDETTTSSSSGQYQTPHMWAPNKKGWANAKKRWWGENSPNTGGSISKGGVVNIKDNCKGYSNSKTQCNSGDIGNITITEEAQNLITKLSKEYNKPVEYIKNLIKEDYCNKVTENEKTKEWEKQIQKGRYLDIKNIKIKPIDKNLLFEQVYNKTIVKDGEIWDLKFEGGKFGLIDTPQGWIFTDDEFIHREPMKEGESIEFDLYGKIKTDSGYRGTMIPLIEQKFTIKQLLQTTLPETTIGQWSNRIDYNERIRGNQAILLQTIEKSFIPSKYELNEQLNNISDKEISQFVTKQLIKEGYLSVDELKQTKDNWRGEGCKNYDDSRDICLDKKVNELYLQDRPIYKHKRTGEVWEASEVGYRDITLVNLKNPTMIINVDKEELKNEYIKLGSGLGENTGPDTSGLYGSYKDVEGDMSLMSPDITENKLK